MILLNSLMNSLRREPRMYLGFNFCEAAKLQTASGLFLFLFLLIDHVILVQLPEFAFLFGI
jgi:hypothetical protein